MIANGTQTVGRLVAPTPTGLAGQVSLIAAGSAGVVWVAGIFTGFTSGTVFPIADVDPNHHPWAMVWPILLTNGSVALSLSAGVVSFGTASLFGAFVVGAYTGAVWHACWFATGMVATLTRLLPFFAFELTGLYCATVAGLLPAIGTIVSSRQAPPVAEPQSWWRLYVLWMGKSAPWLVATFSLLFFAAFLEVIQGVPR